LVNLVGNAVKFTSQGEVVIELLCPQAGRLEFRVSDTGIGIPEDRRDRLFQSFSQVDASTTRRFGGTGLGLVISRQLVQLLGGGIRVEGAEGQGSTFIFDISAPVAGVLRRDRTDGLRGRHALVIDGHAATAKGLRLALERLGLRVVQALDLDDAQTQLADQPLDFLLCEGALLGNEEQRWQAFVKHTGARLITLNSLGAQVASIQAAASLTTPVRGAALETVLRELLEEGPRAPLPQGRHHERPLGALRILLAEDNAINRKVALRMLQKLGLSADAVENGRQAVEALEQTAYDVVLMDVQMPEMDGMEATRRIRALNAVSQPHVVAMTANAVEGDRQACLEAGMNDYVSKPVRLELLEQALQRVPRPVAAPSADAGPEGQTLESQSDGTC
jgi:CheY-like chemotaxis protein